MLNKLDLEKEYQINMNQVGAINDDPFGETHQKFKSIPSNIQFHPVGINERSETPLKEQDKLVEPKEKPQKRHGFDLPLHPQQISTFLLFSYNILMFYIVIIPFIVDVHNIGRQVLAGCLGSFYALLLLIVVKYTYETTIIDPTDKTVYIEREAQLKGYDVVGFDVNIYEYFCNVCKTHVLEHTKHCQQCNRCVQKFDHHCPWLNNCIGVANYKEFIKMLSWVTIAILFQEICAIICFYFKENFQTYNNSNTKLIWILLVVNMGINCPVLLVLLKLLSFHIFLIQDGLTTYQYIIQQREKVTNQKQQSKVILQVKQQKDDVHGNIDIFHNSSPRFSSDDTDKQKTKDMSERNQFIRELQTPSTIKEIAPHDKNQRKCQLLSILTFWKKSPTSSEKLPKSIKVKPINQLAQGSSSECLPRSQSQIEDHLSAVDDDGPIGISGHCKTHQQPSNQIIFTSKGQPPMSNRSKTSKYEQYHETQDNNGRMKTHLIDEEALKLPPKHGKKTLIMHQQNHAIDGQLYDMPDSYRYSNKYEDILKTDQFKLENKSSKDFKGRTSVQDQTGDIINHQRKGTLQQTPLIDNNLSRLSVNPSIQSSMHNANLKQVLNNQLNQASSGGTNTDKANGGEFTRKDSRNIIDRGNSDMQSITSKKKQPYEHKSLA